MHYTYQYQLLEDGRVDKEYEDLDYIEAVVLVFQWLYDESFALVCRKHGHDEDEYNPYEVFSSLEQAHEFELQEIQDRITGLEDPGDVWEFDEEDGMAIRRSVWVDYISDNAAEG